MRTRRKGRWLLKQPRLGARMCQGTFFFKNQDYGRKQREGRLLCYSIKKKRLWRDNRRGQTGEARKVRWSEEENRQKRGWKGFRDYLQTYSTNKDHPIKILCSFYKGKQKKLVETGFS
mgnify:CR=1 FL=1